MERKKLSFIYSLCLLLMAFGPTSWSQEVKSHVVSIADSSKRVELQNIEIGDVRSGEPLIRRIRLENLSQIPLEILSVHKSCNCTQVVMPANLTAKQGQVLEVDLKWMGEKYLQSPVQRFSVMFQTRGPREQLTIQIELNLTHHMTFTKAHQYIQYAESAGSVSFNVPLSHSSDVKSGDYEINFGDEIKSFLSGRIVQGTGQMVVECTVDISKLAGDCAGIIRISRKGQKESQSISECVLDFSRTKWFTVLPTTLTFIPKTYPGEILREAKGVVRIRVGTDELGELSELKCETSKGVKLPTAFEKVRNGFYRITISTLEVDDVQSHEKLKLSATTPNGRADAFVSCVLSN